MKKYPTSLILLIVFNILTILYIIFYVGLCLSALIPMYNTMIKNILSYSISSIFAYFCFDGYLKYCAYSILEKIYLKSYENSTGAKRKKLEKALKELELKEN